MSSTKTPLQFCKSTTIDHATRQALYSGQLVVLKHLKSATDLCDYFNTTFLSNERPSSDAATQPQAHSPSPAHSTSTIADRIDSCERFEASSEVAQLYSNMFKEAGLTPQDTHWDRLRLRIQHSGDPIDNYTNTSTFGAGRFSSTLPVHRDTWGSNIMQQLNWWMPLKPLHQECTLILYPSYFNQPVANTSNEWHVKDLIHAKKLGTDYPQLPTMKKTAFEHKAVVDGGGGGGGGGGDRNICVSQEELDLDAVPILIDPGDVLVFSGAHLHGSSVGGTKGFTRYSTEVRTYNVLDFDQKCGAQNIDGPDVLQPNQKWFKPLVV